jgi:protein-tyrosine phosphatase
MTTQSHTALRLARDPVSLLFVCTGNICRSPTAAGVFARYVADAGLQHRIRVASAGTGDYHLGQAADSRSLNAALKRGYDFSAHRAQQFQAHDFQSFDVLLAMDEGHFQHMAQFARSADAHKLHLMMSFARRHPGLKSVPDPYYGGPEGFERVLDMLEDASAGLLAQVREQLGC